jgi:RNA polymerase sigma-70 factor (ECF subfamily)
VADDEDQDRAVDQVIDRAVAAHPGLAAYAPDLTARVAELGPTALDHADDLLLAGASAAGDPLAIAALNRHVEALAPALRRVGVDGDDLADLLQELREWLFVGDGSGPRIRSYSGRGSIAGWLRVVAIRRAHRARAAQKRTVAPEILDLQPPGLDVELDYLKQAYRSHFSAALRSAIAELPRRERNLLRLHVSDRLTIDQLAAVYHLHRATVARQLAAARQSVVERMRAELAQRLQVDTEELESVLRLIASNIEVSLASALRATPISRRAK